MTRAALAAALLTACAHAPAAPTSAAAPMPPAASAPAVTHHVVTTLSGLPVMSSVPLDVVGEIPSRLRDARFEVEQRDGTWAEAAPVGDDEAAPAPGPELRRESFFVDYDQPPLAALCAPGAMTAADVVARTDALFARKSLALSFVPASVGAARAEGDCTEHATVAAALLRCHGVPARLALGVLVGRAGERWVAGGHMWAERYEGAWRVTDATRPERHGEFVHLRMAVVTDEGPGARHALVPALQHTTLRVRVSARPAAAVPSTS